MFSPLPCFATLSRSTTPRKPDSRANCPVISGRPIGLIESTSISPSSIRYRLPTLTWGRVHILTLQVISPRRTPSRRRLAKTMRTSLHPVDDRVGRRERNPLQVPSSSSGGPSDTWDGINVQGTRRMLGAAQTGRRPPLHSHGDGSRHSPRPAFARRSEEHTSELQSLRHLVCRLLLEK